MNIVISIGQILLQFQLNKMNDLLYNTFSKTGTFRTFGSNFQSKLQNSFSYWPVNSVGRAWC